MEEKKSFWTTLPGILTGIASVLAALGGLIGAWYQFFHTVPEAPKRPSQPVPYQEPIKTGPAKTVIPAPPSMPPKTGNLPGVANMPAAPKLSTLMVLVNFGDREIRAGEHNWIKVLALSPDGKAVIKEAKVIITASSGFFSNSGSFEDKGTTDESGIFATDWYTHENLLPKGETIINFDVVVSKEGEEGYGKGNIVVTKE